MSARSPAPWGKGGCIPAIRLSISSATAVEGERAARTTKRVNQTKIQRKCRSTVPSFRICSRFGTVPVPYPMSSTTVANNWDMAFRPPETRIARSLRSLPGRAGVGSFLRAGTLPPRNPITTHPKRSQKCQRCFSFAGQTLHSGRLEGDRLTYFQGFSLRLMGQPQKLFHPV